MEDNKCFPLLPLADDSIEKKKYPDWERFLLLLKLTEAWSVLADKVLHKICEGSHFCWRVEFFSALVWKIQVWGVSRETRTSYHVCIVARILQSASHWSNLLGRSSWRMMSSSRRAPCWSGVVWWGLVRCGVERGLISLTGSWQFGRARWPRVVPTCRTTTREVVTALRSVNSQDKVGTMIKFVCIARDLNHSFGP